MSIYTQHHQKLSFLNPAKIKLEPESDAHKVILLDGHNRYEICRKHGIKFNTVEAEIDDRDEARSQGATAGVVKYISLIYR